MPAHVEERAYRTVRLPYDEHRIFGHVGRDVIARIRELTLVSEKQLRPREDAFEFEFVDVGIGVDAGIDEAALGVDECGDGGGVHAQPNTPTDMPVINSGIGA